MPYRKLPQRNPARFRALKAVKERKDVTPPADVPLTTATITRFDLFYPQYKTKYLAVTTALTAQSTLTNQIKVAKVIAGFFISDMIDALQNAIRRGTFEASVRGLYMLPVGHAVRPELRSDQDVLDWAERVHDGETARIAAGGAPITFPSLAEVDAAVNTFKTLNLQQAAAKLVYDNAQEALEEENIEADKLILKLWNEIETTYDVGNKPSLRRKAREWGVFYLPTPGEAPNPEEFSIVGKVTVQGLGTTAGIEDVTVTVAETGSVSLTLADGDYYIVVQPPGVYNLQFEKAGYAGKTISGVAVATGSITTLNVELAPIGIVQGTVLLGGLPVNASISIAGYPMLNTSTDPMGNFSIPNAPSGTQSIRAEIVGSSPPNFQTQSVVIPEGGTATVNFNF